MTDYTKMICEVCRVGAPPVTDEALAEFFATHPDWERLIVDDEPRLRRLYRFADFAAALTFTNAIGELAESEGHHPALLTEWGRVTVDWWTHKIGDIHLNDLIMAARGDTLYDAAG